MSLTAAPVQHEHGLSLRVLWWRPTTHAPAHHVYSARHSMTPRPGAHAGVLGSLRREAREGPSKQLFVPLPLHYVFYSPSGWWCGIPHPNPNQRVDVGVRGRATAVNGPPYVSGDSGRSHIQSSRAGCETRQQGLTTQWAGLYRRAGTAQPMYMGEKRQPEKQVFGVMDWGDGCQYQGMFHSTSQQGVGMFRFDVSPDDQYSDQVARGCVVEGEFVGNQVRGSPDQRDQAHMTRTPARVPFHLRLPGEPVASHRTLPSEGV